MAMKFAGGLYWTNRVSNQDQGGTASEPRLSQSSVHDKTQRRPGPLPLGHPDAWTVKSEGDIHSALEQVRKVALLTPLTSEENLLQKILRESSPSPAL